MDSEAVLPGDIVSIGTPQSLTAVSKIYYSGILVEYYW